MSTKKIRLVIFPFREQTFSGGGLLKDICGDFLHFFNDCFDVATILYFK